MKALSYHTENTAAARRLQSEIPVSPVEADTRSSTFFPSADTLVTLPQLCCFHPGLVPADPWRLARTSTAQHSVPSMLQHEGLPFLTRLRSHHHHAGNAGTGTVSIPRGRLTLFSWHFGMPRARYTNPACCQHSAHSKCCCSTAHRPFTLTIFSPLHTACWPPATALPLPS